MDRPDEDMIKGFLMALQSTMDACDRVSTVTGQLLASQRDNAQMRDTIAKWWTLVEDTKH
jgi:hypothetical protein